MFANKARDITRNHKKKLESPLRDKQSSLLDPLSYEENEVLLIWRLECLIPEMFLG